ncbi:MAG: hypothetical protein RLZ44_1206 [Pseudomonadota bacterium]
MKQTLLRQEYPVFKLEMTKAETRFASVDAIIAYLEQRIRAHPAARYIATFDHYRHTEALPQGEVTPEILAAKNIVFCFGLALPDPDVLASRPRAIGVAELADRFVVTFLEAPMPVANSAMEDWVKSLADRAAA